eukprot:m.380170 g.380170  ORF g.380170 m.380170 type:complete len:78 (+) comp56224_c0_seq7:509-742(+)
MRVLLYLNCRDGTVGTFRLDFPSPFRALSESGHEYSELGSGRQDSDRACLVVVHRDRDWIFFVLLWKTPDNTASPVP